MPKPVFLKYLMSDGVRTPNKAIHQQDAQEQGVFVCDVCVVCPLLFRSLGLKS